MFPGRHQSDSKVGVTNHRMATSKMQPCIWGVHLAILPAVDSISSLRPQSSMFSSRELRCLLKNNSRDDGAGIVLIILVELRNQSIGI